MALDCYKLL